MLGGVDFKGEGGVVPKVYSRTDPKLVVGEIHFQRSF